ncbi:RluA family pseudouridine synthase [Anaerolentibacter hominis]|uniref:RluA family pseudouridine synthase n=1 Tax=Anaerolentibacter hominis TaxID=3079009 RepID=UPI0031B87B64
MNEITLTVEEEQAGNRIDRYLADQLADLSRSFIQKQFKDGMVTVDRKPVKANYRIQAGEAVSFTMPEIREPEILPEDIPLDILYEDGDVIVINKPKGMVVHPAAGHYSHTLVNALLYHCKDSLSGINGILRPGIVHRIDMDTTGVLVACKNDRAHHSLAAQLKEHSITRKYNAIVYNILSEDGTVNAPIGRHPTDRKKMAVNYSNGKEAVTHYHVVENLGGRYSYIECQLETGRTHQIRVHMASIHHPLLGDELYASGRARLPYSLQGQVLHARILGFIHPTTQQYMEFEAPLPEYFTNLLRILRG